MALRFKGNGVAPGPRFLRRRRSTPPGRKAFFKGIIISFWSINARKSAAASFCCLPRRRAVKAAASALERLFHPDAVKRHAMDDGTVGHGIAELFIEGHGNVAALDDRLYASERAQPGFRFRHDQPAQALHRIRRPAPGTARFPGRHPPLNTAASSRLAPCLLCACLAQRPMDHGPHSRLYTADKVPLTKAEDRTGACVPAVVCATAAYRKRPVSPDAG